MLKLNTANINYLKTMRLCDVIDGSKDESLYYNEKTIKALSSFSNLIGFSRYGDWSMTPNHDKTVTLTNDRFFVIVDEKGFIRFIS